MAACSIVGTETDLQRLAPEAQSQPELARSEPLEDSLATSDAPAVSTPTDAAPPAATVASQAIAAAAPQAIVEAAPTAKAHADLDPDNDHVVGPPEPLEGCKEALKSAGVTFKPSRIGLGRKHDGVFTCGAKQVVRYRASSEGIAYSRSPLVTCRMALALAEFEHIVQIEAERELGTRVKKIDHLGTYNCRKMVNYDLISEHSFANGIDLRRFHLEDGRTITVYEHFKPNVTDADADAQTRFLRGLANRLYDEDVFSVVVTPYFDRLHRNHIHVDLARYRVDGSRP